MKKLKPCFRASVQAGGTLELLVYEDIGENFWDGGGITAKTMKQQIDQSGPVKAISVRINSPGGDAFEGVAIMNLLRAQKKPVNVFIDGIAASAASIIAMAGDTITMGDSSMMMVHNAWTVCMGSGDDMRKCADVLDKISASIGEAYAKKTGMTGEQIKAIMDAETWLSAQDCVDQGFATAIAESEPAQMALAKSFKALGKLHNVPDSLKAGATSDDPAIDCMCSCGACVDQNCALCDCTGCDSDMCNGSSNCGCGSTVAESNLSQYEARLQLLRP